MALPDGIDRQKLLEIGLAMLYLTSFGDRFGARAWKGMSWDLLDALHEAGWIADPKSKAKSVALTEEGERLTAELFRKHFGTPPKRR